MSLPLHPALNPACINVFLRIHNELGNLWLERGEKDMAKVEFFKTDTTAREFLATGAEPYSIKVNDKCK